MGEGLKKRLLGAVVLLGLLVLLAPALFRGGNSHPLVVGQLSEATQLQPPPVPEFIDQLDVPPEVVSVVPPPAEIVLAPEKNAEKNDRQKKPSPTEGIDDKGHLKAWTLQLATFADKSNARKLEQKLKGEGYSAYQKTFVNDQGKSLYRVYVGPEVRPDELQQLKPVIHKAMGLEGIIVRFVP